ncbi:MAG TPA: PAS domain S-box protein [Dokdonella sp.]|uniref:sensor domain-containing diguanylate cyclase n=2 Tax=Dokdonella sp. TaxID=2291710 RepID=UPI002C1147C8|nr:PAS domain S-box protein [Dokdonella sp.]HOX70778.1 PAS domain S-box protein [Dokdonella sp.]
MMSAALPRDESKRLMRLRQLEVLDTAAEPLFDSLTRTASLVCDAPIALISLIDAGRQWFKSNVGLEGYSETPRDIAFCAHAILQAGVMEVPDAAIDERFAQNPLVTGQPGIRFYAGAPITLSDGLRIGTLCVIDRRARQLDNRQRQALAALADGVANALEQRLVALDRTAAHQRQVEIEQLAAEDRMRLSGIIEATRAGTWEWDVRTGDLRLNEYWAELIGFPLEELQPTTLETWQLHADPADWSRIVAELKAHLEGRTSILDCELRMIHRDGRPVWVNCRGRIISRSSDGSPLLVCGVIVDNSVRKEAEERLRDSEAFLDRTGWLAGVGGWEVDLETREFTFSDQTCRIHEVAPGYRPGMDEALSYYPPEARLKIEAAVRKAAIHGNDWDLDLPFVTAKGRHIWVRVMGTVEYVDGKPRWLIGAFQETTIRRQAMQALELSEGRFRKLFEHSLGLICTHDLAGNIISINPAAAHALDYSVADVMGRPFKEFVPPSQHEKFDRYLRRILANRTDSGIVQMIARDGSIHTWQYRNIVDDEGDEPYVIGYSQDITERLGYESRLRELSVRDPLTGCFNRRFLDEIETGPDAQSLLGCIAIDLDRFKLINDTYGHQRGDEVLKGMGLFLNRHIREGDAVVRTGGDEFLILLRNAGKSATCRVVEALEAARNEAPIAFTLGHAIRKPPMSLDEALAAADRCLYEVRRVARGE